MVPEREMIDARGGQSEQHIPLQGELASVLRPRVLIVSDVRMYREGLATQLAASDAIEVVAAVSSERSASPRIVDLHPDVVLCDMSLPGGLASARWLAVAHPTVRILVFGVPDNEIDVPACAEAGVAGFVTREASVGDLVAAICGASRGEIVCSPKAAAALYRRVATLSASRAPVDAVDLTVREREIARLIDRDLSNKEIARLLGIEVATTKNHVHHILEKLGVRRRRDIGPRVRGATIRTEAEASVDREHGSSRDWT